MNEEIIARAGEFIATTRDCILALIDADGYPTAARITPTKTKGIEWIAIGNNIESNWAKRAAKCDRASICYSLERPECNRPLAKHSFKFKIANTGDEIEPQPKSPSAISITLGQDLEPLDESDGVFVGNAFA